MAKTLKHARDLQEAKFQGAGFGDYGQSFFISLHTSDPIALGTQSTNEASYDGYARIETPRNVDTWVVDGREAWNKSLVMFEPKLGRDTVVITHIGIGLSTGELIDSLPLHAPVTFSMGQRPMFEAGQIKVIER